MALPLASFVPPTPQRDRPQVASATERPPAKTFSGRFSPLHLLHSSTVSSPALSSSPFWLCCYVGLNICCLFWSWLLFAPFYSARWLSNCKLNYIFLPAGDPPARFAIADVAVQHEGSAQRLPTLNMEPQPPQPPQQQAPLSNSRPAHPHLHNILPPSQIPHRTANSTPVSSPGLFSPSLPRPAMTFPTHSQSESTTPAALVSPYLHPLQSHKVRE